MNAKPLPVRSPRSPLSLRQHNLQEQWKQLQCETGASPVRLRRFWRDRDRPFWRSDAEIYRWLSARFLSAGENFLVIEVAREGLTWFPENWRLRHALALAYARCGATVEAGRQLRFLRKTTLALDAAALGEIHGLSGRIHKDLWNLALTEEERAKHLRLSARRYYEAFLQTGAQSFYLGVNAAAMTFLASQQPQGQQLAAKTLELCQQEIASGKKADYWLLATIAECELMLDKPPEAVRKSYQQAAQILGDGQRADAAATRRQARWLLAAKGQDSQGLDDCWRRPAVVLFAGHMTDLPGRPAPRFPVGAVDQVAAAIAQELARLDAAVGFSSAACGADLLFLQAMQRRGAETHVLLPMDRAEFRRMSVERPGDPDAAKWSQQFDAALDHATSVTELTESALPAAGVIFDYANRVLHGMARQKALGLDLPLRPLVVWDEQPGDGPGGTAGCVQNWSRSARVSIVTPRRLAPADGPSPTPDADSLIPRRDASGDQLEILAALAIKFGHEASVATEMPHFLQAVADALAPWKKMAVHHAVQGARIELIFRNVEAAAHVALRLLAQMRAGDRFWENGLRMGIHAGPIAFTRQSLLGVDEPVGDHARKASHLRDLALWDDRKPQVHASRESAALLSIDESAHGLRCEYQGLYDWGAPYGEQAIYSVRFKNSPR